MCSLAAVKLISSTIGLKGKGVLALFSFLPTMFGTFLKKYLKTKLCNAWLLPFVKVDRVICLLCFNCLPSLFCLTRKRFDVHLVAINTVQLVVVFSFGKDGIKLGVMGNSTRCPMMRLMSERISMSSVNC